MKLSRPFALGLALLLLAMAPRAAMAAETVASPSPLPKSPPTPAAPAELPGKGLAQHDFFYAGEANIRQMFIVRKGKIVWSYDERVGKGEISDAVLLSNSNVLFAHQFGITLISPDKKVLWNYDTPAGFETHTAVPIGKEHVLFIQNGDPAMLKVVDIVTGAITKEFPLAVINPKRAHSHFRHARLTSSGTVLVAHMNLGKVSEYNADGKELASFPARIPWGVEPLKNGNILITDADGVREMTHDGRAVWKFTRADLPDYRLTNLQLAWRLPNGNTLINNWVNPWNEKLDPATAPVQAVEVTPEKKVAWALRSWVAPANLGPATTIQLLDETTAPEDVTFGDIK